ncbi:hypothetical protein DV515_00002236 [Chloebia gouldiae]|uniref:Uncharacterized protein n=1 Tax=Chloebia gouldiae TaxID=44316 RepID=A0A3L8SWX1_CHLGU|nr:hypothetical protein DV515_00002236 [Chloebia gouldiae]
MLTGSGVDVSTLGPGRRSSAEAEEPWPHCGLSQPTFTAQAVVKSPDHTNTTVIARKAAKSNPHAANAFFLI